MADIYRVEKWKQHHAPNPAMLRHILAVEGYDVFHWCDQPGIMYGMHQHPEDQTHWAISGSIEITVERIGTFLLEAGDRDFMPAGCYHSARVIGEEPVQYLIGAKAKKVKQRRKKAKNANEPDDIKRLLDVFG